MPIHIHVSETKLDFDGSLQRRGLTPPQYLEKLGLMEHSVLAAHCVWLTDEDIELLARRGVTVLHNPISNLKLASGIAPVARMLKAGCRITLGTDGVASNNNLNLWEEIKLMPMLQKGNTLDPTVVSPAQTIAAATSAGAKAMGYEDLGLIRPGYLADLILLDLSGAHMCPCNDLESNLVYSAQGSDVALTMVNGKVLYRDGEYTTLDPRLVLERAKKQAEALLDRRRRRLRPNEDSGRLPALLAGKLSRHGDLRGAGCTGTPGNRACGSAQLSQRRGPCRIPSLSEQTSDAQRRGNPPLF